MANLDNLRDENGNFIIYAWPGGYPVYYLDKENNVLCPNCANKKEFSVEIVSGDIYWEGPSLICDNCGMEIESAYGDPSEGDTDA